MKDGTWKTNNMSLAAFLKMKVNPVDTSWEEAAGRRSCYWYFEDTDELADLVADFMGGMAIVDPKEYNDTIADMKKEMFSLENS